VLGVGIFGVIPSLLAGRTSVRDLAHTEATDARSP
jgi:hypothetical protein